MRSIDLNADVGESLGAWPMGEDGAMTAACSSVNVACGFHAGDPSTIRATVAAAAASGTVIGAHPGYRDLHGFGRRFIDVAPTDLRNEVIYQIGALQALAHAEGTAVRYVKPHGALYNTIAHNPEQARAVVDAVLAVDPAMPLMVLPGSVVETIAQDSGLRAVPEAFADRAYRPDGTLVPRTEQGAVHHELDAVVAQSLRLALHGEIVAIDGTVLTIGAESICLHGDTPGAVSMALAVRAALQEAGVRIRSFV